MLKSVTARILGVACLACVAKADVALGVSFAPANPFDDCVRSMEKLGPVRDAEYAICMKKESARLLTEVQKVYTQIANDKYFAAWNNGNGMFKGRVRDTYNAWLVYRNSYCDLFAEASKDTGGSMDYNREQCLMDMTKQQLEVVNNVIAAKLNDPE